MPFLDRLAANGIQGPSEKRRKALKTRILVLSLAVVAAALWPGSAGAHISSLSISTVFYPDPSMFVVVTCDAGERVRVRGSISADPAGYHGVGFTPWTQCTGEEQGFGVAMTKEQGSATCQQDVQDITAKALARTKAGGTPHDQEKDLLSFATCF